MRFRWMALVALAVLLLSGCSGYAVLGPDWGATEPPIGDEVYNPYPDLGFRPELARSIALADDRIQGAIEYARRAYGYYSVSTSVRYLWQNNYEVMVRIQSPSTEVYAVRVDTFARRVVSVQSYNEGWLR